ncbi:T9SS type A sorting domain-containing protein [Ferruginibacter lapsinanis]|uniref:T9SS type A sorting domain-containing protein n=1 Tax=Ferruginibacter lapsinanis TaxID=563172 RepID=UPI001E5B5541|nr:T9SS type A sorting domain-containing protein [Ferruginibacter lapsinanis]UEG49652.1 T9SS type A sorting domain-containing protein [Ferruginibacter lapsinanis]
MSKIYSLILSFCISQILVAQCPVINGAMVNSCAPSGGTAEGNNEFIYFTTGASGAISLYKFSYGSNTPPATNSPTGILAGTHAAAKTGTGTIVIQNGCTLHEVTSPSTVIPASSSVVFIPYNFDQQYDMSALCKNGDLYVVYIDITAASDSKWSNNGTLANAATTLRYLQLEYNGNTCTSGIRSYDGDLWANPGNTPEADGNSLAWDASGNTQYVNNGCSIIVTPVKLISFNAIQKGKDVTVTWKTANEINAKQFEVEWSADGTNFKNISTMNAAGTSDVSKEYSFSDKNITTGNNFYRLKTIDADGKFTYSPIVKVNFSGSSLVKIYPQITSGNLTLELNANEQGVTTALIFDHTGRLLSTKQIPVVSGYNKVQLTVNNLPAGGYILKLVNVNDINITRFSKL